MPEQNRKVLLRAEPELIKAVISMQMIKGTMLESGHGFMVVNECVIDICSDIICHVSYELYNNPTSVYLEKNVYVQC